MKPLLPYPEESRIRYTFLNGSQQGQECYILSSADRENIRWYNAITNNNTLVSFPESCITEVLKIPQTVHSKVAIQHHHPPSLQAPPHHGQSGPAQYGP